MKLNDLEMSTVKLIISKINAYNTEKPWLQEELFKSFDELIENNIKVLITVICDRGLLSHEQLTKQSSFIDLFLKYLNTDHKREEAFSKHCSNEHFIFLTKIWMHKLYDAIGYINSSSLVPKLERFAKLGIIFEKLKKVVNIIQRTKNEDTLHLTANILNMILTEKSFAIYEDSNSFHEYCRYTLIDVIESMEKLRPNIIPILCNIIAENILETSYQKARKLLLERIEQNPSLLILDLNGKKKLSLLSSKKSYPYHSYNDNFVTRIIFHVTRSKDTYNLIKQILSPKVVRYIESQDTEPQSQEKELNILNSALIEAIDEGNYEAIRALYEIKSNTKWHDKQQFFDALLTNTSIGNLSNEPKKIGRFFLGLLSYLKLEKMTLEDLFNKISDQKYLIDSIENLLSHDDFSDSEKYVVSQVFNFLAKNPHICKKVNFEVKVDRKTLKIGDDNSKILADLIISNKNTEILIPLIKLIGDHHIHSPYMQTNFFTIIQKTTADNSTALYEIIDYLDNRTSQTNWLVRFFDRFESNLLSMLRPEKNKGMFWGNTLKLTNSNGSIDNDSEESSLIEGKKLQRAKKFL